MNRNEIMRLAIQSMQSQIMCIDRTEFARRLSQAVVVNRQFEISQEDGFRSLNQILQAIDKADTRTFGTTTIISVCGPLEFKLSLMGWWMGGCSYRAIGRAIEQAVGDPQVERVVLDVDSPGGTVIGCRELAEQIYKLRGTKDIVAVANPMAASAALKIAAACRQFYGMATAYVGSVGTISWLESYAEMLKEAGIDSRLYSDPEAKGEGWPERPISDEAEAHVKQRVSEMTIEFVADLAKYRGVSKDHVSENFGGGRMMFGAQAAKAGLIDGIKSMDDVLRMRPLKMGNATPRAESSGTDDRRR